MVFNHFRFHVILRILILTAILAAFVYCLLIDKYLRSAYLLIAVIIAVVEFVRYVEKTNRDLTTFLLAIRQNDFTSQYSARGKGKSVEELYDVFNAITQKFRAISEDKEAQHRYLEMLVEHVRVGILSFDSDERIHLINETMKEFLGRPHVHGLKGLENNDRNFVEVIRAIRVGENRLVKMQINGKVVPLTIHASEFTLQSKSYKLISAQDIRNELDANELEAWQKLIRVLTHEIMNSISPIMSLSSTLHNMVKSRKAEFAEIGGQEQMSLEQGLDAIRIRSEALQHFTKAYRTLTRIPQPHFRPVLISELFEHLTTLFKNEMGESKVTLHVSQPENELEVFADPDLIQQVLINLFRNALDAVHDANNPRIELTARKVFDHVQISLKDNGHGIPHELLDKIFVPFFTTKKNGSGIGLAFSKQIIQTHSGQLNIDTTPGEGTTISIVL